MKVTDYSDAWGWLCKTCGNLGVGAHGWCPVCGGKTQLAPHGNKLRTVLPPGKASAK